MYVMRQIAAAAFITFALNSANLKTAVAEPTPTVNWLMEEPASLFTLGMVRLDTHLQSIGSDFAASLGEHAGTLLKSATYDWDANRVVLNGTVFQADLTVGEARDVCTRVIKLLKFHVGVNGETGKSFFPSSLASNFFSQFGYARKSEPEDLSEEIDKIIIVRGFIGIKNVDEAEGVLNIKCESPILSKGISFIETTVE